jgi:hypothetical protein
MGYLLTNIPANIFENSNSWRFFQTGGGDSQLFFEWPPAIILPKKRCDSHHVLKKSYPPVTNFHIVLPSGTKVGKWESDALGLSLIHDAMP